MEEKATAIETLVDKTEDYVKTTVDLYKLKVVDKSAGVVSSLSVKAAIYIVASVVVLLVNIGLSLLLGEVIGKTYLGFFIVAAFYVLVLLILIIFRKEIVKDPVTKAVINSFFKSDFI